MRAVITMTTTASSRRTSDTTPRDPRVFHVWSICAYTLMSTELELNVLPMNVSTNTVMTVETAITKKRQNLEPHSSLIGTLTAFMFKYMFHVESPGD
jgi:hypothetical protein